MKGDIALAGFWLTAEEWEALDAASRVQLIAAVMRRDPFAAAAVPTPTQWAEGSAPVREDE